MPLFNCSKCGCIENTALGEYWGEEHPLCSECGPDGKWHGCFPKQTPEEGGYVLLPDGFYGPPGGWK